MDTKARFSIRPEVILGLVALLTMTLFGILLYRCVPYMLSQRPRLEAPTEPAGHTDAPVPPEELTEEVTEETMEPTIPPEANPYNKRDFQYNDSNFLLCTKQPSYAGVDVSAFQGEIDWDKVASSGIRFAIIRLGYRGWGKAGKLVEDEYAKANLEGAKKAGLQVGAYFFSQALTTEEVDQEIEFMLNTLGDFHLDMPIVFDWEIPVPEARTANMDARTLTDLQKHFASTMAEKGHDIMIYFNWNISRNLLYLSELEDYPFWLALYQDRMTYPFRVEMWQYTDRGQVPGIQGNVDVNVYMP
ncbi:MAG: glycoside hydrolase family 25 protein [Candidatus Faecousia sp.]|nr:glycoside hydrolase family 25 protein [Clostridiales bacterium]MDY6179319.1 glycoside hydrolase family 25 protein [Candidatus Faecousia sp.]